MFCIIVCLSTEPSISIHLSLLISKPFSLLCIIDLSVLTTLSANGGGVDVIICLILCEFINMINSVLLHDPSLSWYMTSGTPIFSKTFHCSYRFLGSFILDWESMTYFCEYINCYKSISITIIHFSRSCETRDIYL